MADRILSRHGWGAIAIVFLLPTLESSAFVGFIFPGEIAVLLGGVLAYQHRVTLPAVLLAAVAGAIIGDSVGYEIGKRWGWRMLHGTIGRIVKHEHLDWAEVYLADRGGKAVFFGRFTAALRVLIPGLAGMSRMRYRTFLLYNAAGGALWATGFVMAGYAAGSSWRGFENAVGRASVVVLLLLVIAVVVVVSARRVALNSDRIRAVGVRQLDRPFVARLGDRLRPQLDFALRRLRPAAARGLSLTVSLVVLAGGWWWWRYRTARPLLFLGTAYIGAEGLFRTVKALTGRTRPSDNLAVHHFGGLAFPSAHATLATAVWGGLAALIAAASTTWRAKVIGPARFLGS